MCSHFMQLARSYACMHECTENVKGMIQPRLGFYLFILKLKKKMFMQIHCNRQHHLAIKANTRVDPTKNEKVMYETTLQS